MKKKKFELEWFVYAHGVNCNGFRKMNIFNHFRFKDNKITLSSWMGNKEGILDVTDDTDFDWNGFYEKNLFAWETLEVRSLSSKSMQE